LERSKQLFRTLAVANFFLYFGFNVWRALFNNYAVEELGVRADQIGVIQAIREAPGLMGFLLGFLALWFSEKRILAFSILLMGAGLILTGISNSTSMLTVSILVMSTGFHFFYPSNSSMVLMGVGKEEAPKMLGRLQGIASIAAVVSTVAVWFLVDGFDFGSFHIQAWGYRTTLLVAGGLVAASSLITLRSGQRSSKQVEKRKVIFRRRYWLYYLLTFLMGSRRHIFTTFAIFLLVQVYGINVRQTATLFLVNSLISTFTAGQLGKLVAHFGERKVLTLNFIGLIGVFFGYAYIPYLPVLYALFILDHIFFGFNVAVDSYFQKIAVSQEEITSNVSMAQTINHISALIVPIVGGILWEAFSPSATFLSGVVIAVVTLVLVQFIRTGPSQKHATHNV
jgi:MFS family permease